MTTVLSFDLGASSGMLMAQKFDGNQLALKEIHRFVNGPIEKNGHYYWDFEFFMKEIVKGIQRAQKEVEGSIDGIGIDTWGVDFGLVNASGQLVTQPFSYRDTHTIPYMEEVLKEIAAFDLFKMTGNEVAAINTLFQLKAIAEKYPAYLEETKHILMTPNLVQFALTGIAQNEFTIASTSQMVENNQPKWHDGVLAKFFDKPLPLADIHLPHQVMGNISKSMQRKEQLADIPVILTPGHDTACALSALPIQQKNACFMSMGTWTLVGKEVDQPVITLAAFEEGFTNEGTSEGAYRFQRNGMGFWILQNLRQEWKQRGEALNYEQENDLLRHAGVNEVFIDPDDDLFFNPKSMEEAIQIYCAKTQQVAPKTQQELLQCVHESMALKYAYTIRRMEEMTNEPIDLVYMGGGGIQSSFMCQFIANATNKQVFAGPIEASAIGNGLSQLRALGELKSLAEGRELVARSFEMTEYNPQETSKWELATEVFMTYIK